MNAKRKNKKKGKASTCYMTRLFQFFLKNIKNKKYKKHPQ